MVAVALAQKVKRIEKLIPHCTQRIYPAKSTIIYAGDPCHSLYFIVKGSVTILIEDDEGKDIIIAYLNAGDVIGELGLFGNNEGEHLRSAWARARTDCTVVEITYSKFMELRTAV